LSIVRSLFVTLRHVRVLLRRHLYLLIYFTLTIYKSIIYLCAFSSVSESAKVGGHFVIVLRLRYIILFSTNFNVILVVLRYTAKT